jgi:MoxR-like ATPase
MSRININTRVTLAQAKTAIATMGAQRTVLLQGEPGIGKSWLLKDLAADFPEHKLVYIDCQLLLDQGDFFYPFIDVMQVNGRGHGLQRLSFRAVRDKVDGPLLALNGRRDELVREPVKTNIDRAVGHARERPLDRLLPDFRLAGVLVAERCAAAG